MNEGDRVILEKEIKGYKLTVYIRGDYTDIIRYGYKIDTPNNRYTPDMYAEPNYDTGLDRANREITIATTTYGSLKVGDMDELAKEMSVAVEVAKEFSKVIEEYSKKEINVK